MEHSGSLCLAHHHWLWYVMWVGFRTSSIGVMSGDVDQQVSVPMGRQTDIATSHCCQRKQVMTPTAPTNVNTHSTQHGSNVCFLSVLALDRDHGRTKERVRE